MIITTIMATSSPSSPCNNALQPRPVVACTRLKLTSNQVGWAAHLQSACLSAWMPSFFLGWAAPAVACFLRPSFFLASGKSVSNNYRLVCNKLSFWPSSWMTLGYLRCFPCLDVTYLPTCNCCQSKSPSVKGQLYISKLIRWVWHPFFSLGSLQKKNLDKFWYINSLKMGRGFKSNPKH